MRVGLRSVSALAVLAALAGCASAPREPSLAGQYLAGRFAASSNSVGDAAAAFADGSAIAPGESELLKGALFFYLADGDIESAAVYARRILAAKPLAPAGEATTDDAASADATKVKAGDPSAPDDAAADEGLAHVTLAAEALKRGRLEDARAHLSGSMESPFLESIAFLMDVWIEKGLSGPEAALAKIDNPDPRLFAGFNTLHRALLSEEAGRIDAARASYQAAVFSFGGPVGRAAYGAFLERAGDEAAARSYYEILAADSGPWRRAAAQAYQRLERGAPTKAFAQTTPAEGAAIAFFSIGGAFVEHAVVERARAIKAGFTVGAPPLDLPLALAQIALYLDPDRVEARQLVGMILDGYEDYEAARAVLEPIPPSSPQYEQARVGIASGYVATGDGGEAARVLRNAIRHDRDSVELKWMLGNLYAGQGEHGRAVEAYSGVIKTLGKNPSDDAWRYYVARGGSLLEMGRWPEAEADLKRAVEIAPGEPTALNYLGYSWAERGVNLEEAFRLIEKAVELQPESGAIIDSLGWAHFQLGRYDDAVGHLEEAVRLEPGDPTITDHLGDVYWRLGRETEARYQWRRALTLDPPEKLKASVEQKIERGLGSAN